MNDIDLQQRSALIRDSDDTNIADTLDGIITGWHDGAERICISIPADVIGRPATVLIPPDHDGAQSAIVQRWIDDTGTTQDDCVRGTKDGRVRALSPIRDGASVISVASSIGQHVADEKAALTAYQLTMEQDLVLVRYPDQRLLEANQCACELLGFSRGAVLQLTGNSFILPEYRARPSTAPSSIHARTTASIARVPWRSDGTGAHKVGQPVRSHGLRRIVFRSDPERWVASPEQQATRYTDATTNQCERALMHEVRSMGPIAVCAAKDAMPMDAIDTTHAAGVSALGSLVLTGVDNGKAANLSMCRGLWFTYPAPCRSDRRAVLYRAHQRYDQPAAVDDARDDAGCSPSVLRRTVSIKEVKSSKPT